MSEKKTAPLGKRRWGALLALGLPGRRLLLLELALEGTLCGPPLLAGEPSPCALRTAKLREGAGVDAAARLPRRLVAGRGGRGMDELLYVEGQLFGGRVRR